jgi:hypothetical protein
MQTGKFDRRADEESVNTALRTLILAARRARRRHTDMQINSQKRSNKNE